MSETKTFSPDLFAWFRKRYDTIEQLVGPATEKLITTQRFARLNGKVMEALLLLHRANRETVSSLLRLANFPAREDLTRLGELVLQLEEKVDQLTEKVDSLEQVLLERAGERNESGQPA